MIGDPVRAERRAPHECVDADPSTEPPVPVVLVAARAERRRKGMHHGVAQTRARCRHMLTVVEELAHDRQEDLEMRCVAFHVDAVDRVCHRLEHHERERQKMPLRHAALPRHLARDLGSQRVCI